MNDECVISVELPTDGLARELEDTSKTRLPAAVVTREKRLVSISAQDRRSCRRAEAMAARFVGESRPAADAAGRDAGWTISVDLQTAILAERLAEELARSATSVVSRRGASLSVRTPDKQTGQQADAAVVQFIADHRPQATVTVRRRDAEASEWLDSTRTYDEDPTWINPADEELEPLEIAWIDLSRLQWEAQLIYADVEAADTAAAWLADIRETVLLRSGVKLTLYAPSERAASDLASVKPVKRGLRSVGVRRLSRVQRWLLAQRLAGSYGAKASSEYGLGAFDGF